MVAKLNEIEAIKAKIFKALLNILERYGLTVGDKELEIIYLYLSGFNPPKISATIGVPEAEVKAVLQNQAVKDALAEITAVLSSAYVDELLLFLTRGSIAAINYLLETLENSDDPRIKLDVAKFIVDKVSKILMTQRLRLRESEAPNIELVHTTTLFDELK